LLKEEAFNPGTEMSFDIGNPDADVIAKYKMIAPEWATDEKIWECACDHNGEDSAIEKAIGAWWVDHIQNESSAEGAGDAPPPAPSDEVATKPKRAPAPRPRASRMVNSSGYGSVRPSHDESTTEDAEELKKKKKEKKEKKEKTEKTEKERRKPPARKTSVRSNASQVRLLAEHCFTLSDEAVQSLVRYRIPSQSRWDSKQKLHVRDETIKHLQRALDLLNQEKQRFKTACIDIENSLQSELGETKNELAVANVNGGGGGGADPAQMQMLREDLAEARAASKAKDKDVADAHDKVKDLETKVTDLQEKLMQSHFEKREGDADAGRAAHEVDRLSEELAKSREALELKNKELSQALQSFADHQAKAESMANELADRGRGNDDRHKELEKEKNELLNELANFKAKTQIAETELASVRAQFGETKAELEGIQKEYEGLKGNQSGMQQKYENERILKERAQQMEENERRERIAACAQLLAIEQHHAVVSTQGNAESEAELGRANEKLKEMKVAFEETKAELKAALSKSAQLQGELAGVKASVDTANMEDLEKLAKMTGEVTRLEEVVRSMESENGAGKAEYEKQIAELEARHKVEEKKVFDLEGERRKLQNQIQELRGNVRVFARLRPFLPNDHKREDEESVLTVGMDQTSMVLRDPNKAEGEKGAVYKFNFDRSFAPHEGQEEVFADVKEFVQSALDGYNVTLFSYGQTGSGKTHSMQGSGNDKMRGIIPRAIEHVGDTKMKLIEQGWEFEMKVQYVEIYNEVVRDLLNEGEQGTMRILRDAYGMTEVEGVVLMAVAPENKSEIDHIMDIAARNRSVCKTDMNAESSRSHSIFTLHLVARNASQNAVLRGQLNLCDLAGSERVDRSGAQGKALAEAKNINKSLSCLSGVFTAINNKSQHVPFRDSKLTYLLQPSFSGDGKTLMMINLSPTEMSHFESLSTLRFGTMVNSCELGKATKNLNDIDVDKKKSGKGEKSAAAAAEEEGDKPKKKAASKSKSPVRTARSPVRK